MNKTLFIIILIVFIELKVVSAYIDPGTGGMVVGSVWPFILGVFAAIGGFFLECFFKPIKKGVLKLWSKIKRKN